MSRQLSFATIVIGKSGLIREGLSRILFTANSRTLASISSIEEVRSRKLRKSPLLFLLVHTDDDSDVTLEQIEFLRDWAPASRIAIVADRYRPGEPLLAFRAGVNGYFVNVTSCAVFIKSIELIMMGETIFPPEFLSHALEAGTGEARLVTIQPRIERTIFVPTEEAIAPHLSPRERSILHCLIEGASNKTIARKMDIAEATVKVHVKAILRKIGVQNRTQAAIWGVNNGPLTGLNGGSLPGTAMMTS
ncbi:MAG: transcriptional regulator [Tardiphaga sp.]|jgi:DNA-binding NarL/FixJ family response regulator|uniref:LuxR C-terminal-related transcriptional regulator n=1 Tax=Tardiphaga sp. TaxID=1926292 RepID=UPI002631B5FF|nr:response regulator transcription factor [Tardiphaga sp.]MDB5500874.1 transcriptional regulator [Tardiphaga sp.]